MISFQVNALIEWPTENDTPHIERVLWIDPAGAYIVTIDIYDKNAFPISREYKDLEDAVKTNEARVLLKYEPFLPFSFPDENIKPEYLARRDMAWELISPLLSNPIEKLFDRRTRGRLIRELAESTGRRKDTLRVLLRHYLQRGCNKNALLPGWHFCGQGEGREDHGKKRGRPTNEKNEEGNSVGRNVTAEDRDIFREGIKNYVNTGDANDLKAAWQIIKEIHYSIGSHELVDGEIAPTILPATEIPTFEQFEYFYRTNRDLKAEIIGREGVASYNSNHRPILSSSRAVAFGPGSLYQIDATVGDIYLVSYLDRKLIIGRPIIYLVVDTFSRLIVGFAVTLEGPSWEGARLALENAFLNKVSFCNSFGVNIIEALWPVEGKCAALIGDNGEIKSYNANSLVDPLNIRVANARPRCPEWKAVVERNFRTLNDIFIDWQPGHIYPHRNVRGRDYRFEAILDLNQFRRLMIKCIRFYNNCYRLKEYRKDEFMIPKKITPIPMNLWRYGIENLTGKLRWESPEAIRLNLLPEGEASIIRRKGIKYGGLHYTCDLAVEQQWFTRLKGEGTPRLKIGLEPLVDRIHLRLNNSKHHITAHLTDADSIYKGRDWYEMRKFFALERQAGKSKETQTTEQQSFADFHAEMRHMQSEAKEMTDAAWQGFDRSKAAQIHGIRENREALKAHERKHGPTNPDQPDQKNETATVISMKTLQKPPMPGGYIPPARPLDELRKARERAKKDET